MNATSKIAFASSLALCVSVGSAQDDARIRAVDGSVPELLLETRALAAGDVDGDGDLDLFLGNVGQTSLWLNEGGRRFVDATHERLPKMRAETNGLALVDLDGDGDLDLFLANGGWVGGQSFLWLNDGKGHFSDATEQIPSDYNWTNGVAAGDVDHDGDLDLVLAKYNTNGVLLNDGKGNLKPGKAELPDARKATMAVALGDVDGDGHLDAVFANSMYEPNRLWLGDGSGGFRDATERLPRDQDDTLAVQLGDVDGDGDLDLFCGNGRVGGQQSRLYLNDGHGRFADVTTSALPELSCETRALVFGDLDGDGASDLVLGNANGLRGSRNTLLLGDGAGRFRPGPEGWDGGEDVTTALLVVDLDGDRRLDLVVANSREGGARSRVLFSPIEPLARD